MIYGSVCSGIEAATVAWHPLGWKPSFFSEIDRFPRAVLGHHYPEVPLHGDFTTIEAGQYGRVDLLVGGTPCQSFSIAGKRLGLDDPRGNLAIEYARMALRLRAKWIVWENVPGVLSSNGGRDFGAFLGILGESGYGWAYRILDAQYVRVDGFPRAVPQQRRRLILVGYLGNWRRAAAVLFEREGLRRDPPPRREAQKSAASGLTCRAGNGSRPAGGTGNIVAGALAGTSPGGGWRCGADEAGANHLIAFGGNNTGGPINVSTALNAHGGAGRMDFESETFVAHGLRGEGFDASEDGTGRATPLVPVPLHAHGQEGSNGAGIGRPGDPAFALDTAGSQAVAFAPTAAATLTRGAESAGKGGYGGWRQEDDANLVAFDTTQITSKTNRSNPKAGKACHPLAARAHPPAIVSPLAVRRLTPRECERLQGFPDDYTAIPYRNKPAADGPRYKALGNSMAVNVMRWLGMRIALVDAIEGDP